MVVGLGEIEGAREGAKHGDGNGAALGAGWTETAHPGKDERVIGQKLRSESGDELMTPSDVAELGSYGIKAKRRRRYGAVRAPAVNREQSKLYGLGRDAVGGEPLGEVEPDVESTPLTPRCEVLAPRRVCEGASL